MDSSLNKRIHMLNTDAWCYLNLENPVCAWAVYRGLLLEGSTNKINKLKNF